MLTIRFDDRTELFSSLTDAMERADKVRKNVETKNGRVKYRFQVSRRRSGGKRMVSRVKLIQN